VTLLNANGAGNGAVVGDCTIQYTAHRPFEKGWAVELRE
jgi:hypothetical protein